MTELSDNDLNAMTNDIPGDHVDEKILEGSEDDRKITAAILTKLKAEEGFYPVLEQEAPEDLQPTIQVINASIRKVNQLIANYEFIITVRDTLLSRLNNPINKFELGDGKFAEFEDNNNPYQVEKAFDVILEEFIGFLTGPVPAATLKYLAYMYATETLATEAQVAGYIKSLSTKSFSLYERLQLKKIALVEDKKVLLGVSSAVKRDEVIEFYKKLPKMQDSWI